MPFLHVNNAGFVGPDIAMKTASSFFVLILYAIHDEQSCLVRPLSQSFQNPLFERHHGDG